MDKIWFSIIVPVYNAEQYLDRMFLSLTNQLFQQIEIILVDDGSTDTSRKKCDEFAEQDNRVTVIHKVNGGLSTARNAGIRVARGEYISFVDADDYMDLDTYEKIYQVVETFAPDCIDFGWKYINECGEITTNVNKVAKNILLHEELETLIIPPLLNLVKDEENFIYDFSTNKIYKRSILIENNILFNEKRRTWEDRIFVIQYLKYCKNYYSMDRCFYNYVSVPNSLSRKYDLNFFEIIIENYNIYIQLFGNKYDFNTPYVKNYWSHSIENMIIRSLKEKNNVEIIEQNIKSTLRNNQVVEWFTERIPENAFEAEISNWVEEQQIQKVIETFRKKIKNEEKNAQINRYKLWLKRNIKKICIRENQ